jgi:hypothetical protein
MGGKLLVKEFGLPEKRFSREEYSDVCKKIIKTFKAIFPSRKIEDVAFLKGKSSFGDIDMIYERFSNEMIDWMDFFHTNFSEVKPHKNGMVISTVINGGQVDFIGVGSEKFECATNYYAYSCGMMCGVISNKIGCKYGFDGLHLKVPLSDFSPELPDHQFKEILITRNTEEIFNILGFDYAWFNRGFENLIELFDWVVGSTYFNPAYYFLESLNHTNRKRNAKRTEFTQFIEWVKEMPARKEIDRAAVRYKILEEYPHLYDKIADATVELQKANVRKQKFNGQVVQEALNIVAGPELGSFIISFKKFVAESYEDFEVFLDSHTKEYIIEEIKKHEHNRSK